MGMKKPQATNKIVLGETTSITVPQTGIQVGSLIPPVPAVPSVPSLPKTTVAPKADPKGVSPVLPAVNNGETGMAKRFTAADDKMSKADWQNKDKGISIDAIHKSTLESPTLANMAIGKSDSEVRELVRVFLKFNLELNQLAKRGEL